MIVLEIIDKYEVPDEYHEALYDAYIEGAKQGFIDGSINVLNAKEPQERQEDK